MLEVVAPGPSTRQFLTGRSEGGWRARGPGSGLVGGGGSVAGGGGGGGGEDLTGASRPRRSGGYWGVN